MDTLPSQNYQSAEQASPSRSCEHGEQDVPVERLRKEFNRLKCLKYRHGRPPESESEMESKRSAATVRKKAQRTAKGPISDEAKESNRVRSLLHRMKGQSASDSEHSDTESKRNAAALRKAQRTAKGPISDEARESNRLRSLLHRKKGQSASDSEHSDTESKRSAAALRKAQRTAKGPISDEARESNRLRSLEHRKSASESEKSETESNKHAAALRRNTQRKAKGPVSDGAREINRLRSLEHRKSASESENSAVAALRRKVQRAAKGPISEEVRNANRLRCSRYRSEQSSASESEKEPLRARASLRRLTQRTALAANHRELCPFCNEEGHLKPTSITSCMNYCTYCEVVAHNVKQCPKEKADILKARNMSIDAANYKNAIEQTMVFYTCAVCEVEHGLHLMTELSTVQSLIEKSSIAARFEAMLSPLQSSSATLQQKAYAKAAEQELVGGLLKDAKHVCSECIKQLNGEKVTNDDSDSDDAQLNTIGNVPARALVNGYFRGKCPPELQALTRTDISLITIINVFVTLSMLRDGGHWGTQGTVFSVLNDVAEIAAFLPHNPTPAQHAVIRRGTTSSPKDYRYNPYRVLKAMAWLEANNELYHGKTASVLLDNGQLDSRWAGEGVNAELEPEHIEATDEDYEGIEDNDMEDPAGTDGHPVNPGAPDSSMTDVFLQGAQTLQSHVLQIRTVIAGAPPPVVTIRQFGEYVSDYDVESFLAKAFPVLYPYGKGCPSCAQTSSGIEKFGTSYISHVLHQGGDRSFQQCPAFIFYCYSWVMRKKMGTISYLASKGDTGSSADLTVDAVKDFLENLKNDPVNGGITTAEQRTLLNKLKPYAVQAPGTELYFEKERKNLLTMISSPVTTSEGQWTWFFTEAQPDTYLAEIFDNAITSARESMGFGVGTTLEQRRALSDKLSHRRRTEILRDHPFLSARIHGLQQDAFWKYILNGEDKPLGEIVDHWLRAEFQMKGTPHWHSLISILKRSLKGINKLSVESADVSERQKVLDFVEAASTNKLVIRDGDNHDDLPEDPTAQDLRYKESLPDFNVERTKYFKDPVHPARKRFVAEGVNFSISSVTGQIQCPTVRRQYRRLQLANQMHLCRKSCFKYCKVGKPARCRYDYPRKPIIGNDTGPVIVKDKDKRNRPRVKVHPTRNNANINTCFASPLCVLATRGNHDIQYIQNVRGGAEYCSKYASKAEAAETTALQNAINRKLATYVSQNNILPNLRSKLGMVANAVVEAQQVGAVQACYTLGKLKLIICSRKFIHLNTLKRSEVNHATVIIDEDELSNMEGNASALQSSPSSQLGRRDAYHKFCVHQQSTYATLPADLTFYAFAIAYRLSALTPKKVEKKSPQQVQLDEFGFVSNPKSFVIDNVVYTAIRRKPVLCLSPSMPVDETNEASAYTTLLLYSSWGLGGENTILDGDISAVVKLSAVKEHLPEFVKRSLRKTVESQTLLANSGETPVESVGLEEADEGDDGGNDYHAPVHVMGVTGVAPDLSSERFNYNTPAPNIAFLQTYINGIKDQHKEKYASEQRLTPEEAIEQLLNPQIHHDIPNVDAQRDLLEHDVAQLNAEQRNAYNVAVEHLSGSAGKQLIMFLSGEGGTGKSKVIHTITLYTRILFGKVEGEWGVVLKTAPTGGAAHNIGGSTWHSALGSTGLVKLLSTADIADSMVANLQRKARGTVLFVLDELSLTSCEDLYEISRRLQAATGKSCEPFGGMHVILAGDFFQMRTMSGIPIVQQNIPQNKKEARAGRLLFTRDVTHYCELIHNVRAQLLAGGTLAPLAKFTKHARIGDVTPSNGILPILNDRVVNTHECAMRLASPGAIWITATHKQISAINKRFKLANLKANKAQIKVIARHTPINYDTATPDAATRAVLYSEPGEVSGSRMKLMVSYMNLFVGTRVRLIRNLFVEGGLYNGAMGTVWGFMYRNGRPSPVPEGSVKTRFGDMEDNEREIPIVLVQMDGEDDSMPSCSPSVPRLVPICEIKSHGTVKGLHHRHQLPILPAHARTAHSVQGYTARDGVVVEPGSQFFAGDYTAISRATDKEKVILLGPLIADYFNCRKAHGDYQLLVEQEYTRLRGKFLN